MGKSNAEKTVRDYMTSVSKLVVTPDTDMLDVLKKMIDIQMPAVIVTSIDGELEHIITGTDIVHVLEKGLESSKLIDGTAGEVKIMGRVQYVEEKTLMRDAVEYMGQGHLRLLVVTKGRKATGILTQLDIIEWWMEEYGSKVQKP